MMVARDGFGLNYTPGFPLATVLMPHPEAVNLIVPVSAELCVTVRPLNGSLLGGPPVHTWVLETSVPSEPPIVTVTLAGVAA